MLTSAQVRVLSRLLAMMTAEQLERLAWAMEEIASNGQGLVTIKIYRGHPRFIEKTVTDDLRE